MANLLTFTGSGRVIVDSLIAGTEQQAVLVGPSGPIGQLAGQLNSTIDVAVGPTQTWTLKVQHRLANGTWEDGQVRLGNQTTVNSVPIQFVEGERDLSGGDFHDLVLRVERATAVGASTSPPPPTTSPPPPTTSPPPPTGTSPPPPTGTSVLPVCAPPDARATPEFRLPFRHLLLLAPVFELGSVAAAQAPQLSCAVVPRLNVQIAFDPRYEQVWTLQKLTIGDLASTLSLAPLERLVLEIKTSQRTTFERSALDSSESLESTEATLHDTETVNVAKSNTTTTNWHVDGQGSISGPVGALSGSLSIQAGYSKNVTNTSSYSRNRITERTQKSANSLKTLHKIEVKGASESIVQDRQLRTLRNPYRDRALALNFFQLLKNFNVTTNLVESRLAIAIRVDDIVMDESFVLSNADFLSQNLLDDGLRAGLGQALSVAQPGATGEPAHQTAVTIAQKSLEFLFGGAVGPDGFVYPNMFDLPALDARTVDQSDLLGVLGAALAGELLFGPLGVLAGLFGGGGTSITIPGINKIDRNDPNKSFSADVFIDSALADVLGKKLGNVFAVLSFFYRLTRDPLMSPATNGNNAIRIALAIANAVSEEWNGIDKTTKEFQTIMAASHKTEAIRRLPGFLAMVKQMLEPLVTSSADAAEQQQQQALRALASLLAHLGCNKNYYIQRFLEYQARRTKGQAIVDFASDVWGRVLASPSAPVVNGIRADITDFDVEAAFVDKQNIIIPDRLTATGPGLSGPSGLSAAQLAQIGTRLSLPGASDPITFPEPLSTLIQVPVDGVHLEVSGGACILHDVPDKPFVQADLNIGPSSISINEE